MRIEIKNIQENPQNALRRAGYFFQRSQNDEMSFVRSFGSSGYPRFHIYAKLKEGDLMINIHLDSKKETYGHNTRHHGEYENDGILKEEVTRIKKVLE